MPKIRINPINIDGYQSAATKLTGRWVQQCIAWVTGTNQCTSWRWVFDENITSYRSKSDTLIDKMGFNFSNGLGSYVPENAYITGFNIYFNLLNGEIGANKVFEVYINNLTFEINNTNKKGWNKLSIEGKNVPDLSKTNHIDIDFNNPHMRDRRFITNTVYSPGDPHDFAYEYYMPDHYVCEYYNLSSSYPPYIEIEYQYNAPQASNDLNPNGVTVNPRGPLRFSWNSLINQKQFEFQYRVEGKDWSTPVVEKTANRYYDMPSNTIREGSGTVEWRVRVMEESGVYSDWTTANFTIGVLTQEPPRIVSPLGDYVKNGAPTTFEWDFIAGTTEEQKAFEIEVVLPTETKKFSGQSTETKFTTDLGIKDSIVVYWRIRVQNSFDEWSEWTDRVSYQTIGVPPAPQIISVENNNRPLVQWTSREQESYQLQIEKVDGEVVFKTDSILGATVREYKVKEVLPNGKYVFVLKVTNSYGIESQPIRFTHIIDPAPISKPTVRLFKSDFFVQIESDTLEGEVLRDDKVIGYLKQGEFRDYTGANYKTYIYQVRTFDKDVMAVSDKVGGVTEFGEVNTLAAIDDLSNCFKIEFNLENSVQKTLDYNIKGSEIELEGMKYPFIEFGEHAAAGLSLEFFVDTIEEVRELKKLIDRKKEFLLRESRGSNFQGVLFGFNSEYNTFGYKVSCTMTITGEDYE
jgi:hypothetical protein